jgi:homoaconitate hydratase
MIRTPAPINESISSTTHHITSHPGAIELPSGCGPCVGLGRGLLRDGEVAISATNRNFKGRMGSRNAQAYLASPSVVAASALQGHIACPPRAAAAGAGAAVSDDDEDDDDNGEWLQAAAVLRPGPIDGTDAAAAAGAPLASGLGLGLGSGSRVEIVPDFPPHLSGPVVLTPRANIDTDGIYAGKHCYEDLGPEAQAKVCMENYDPNFARLVRAGDMLVAGPNFGCGSSREQAATALRASGVRAVVCASANETFRRNALNNALLLVEAPALVRELTQLQEQQGGGGGGGGDSLPPTTRLESVRLALDFEHAVATLEGVKGGSCSVVRTCPFTPVGTVAQEIIVAGGLEGWVKRQRQLHAAGPG